MFGSTFEGNKIDFGCIELILTYLVNWFYWKIEIVASNFRIDFYTKVYCATYFDMNVSEYKSLYLQLILCQNQFSQNQFYSQQNQTYA
jgi:hypothetical protein